MDLKPSYVEIKNPRNDIEGQLRGNGREKRRRDRRSRSDDEEEKRRDLRPDAWRVGGCEETSRSRRRRGVRLWPITRGGTLASAREREGGKEERGKGRQGERRGGTRWLESRRWKEEEEITGDNELL
ncbi:unnamed protein product [Pleuronectes platessa]|uniref:Uncharacterized protein n=1 Tax=Pleuronectes platessa TaxID=8262 RepID=A0A9N7U6W3_PLEPL|nr:unnamed protein product [Pleuronectes platessa]